MYNNAMSYENDKASIVKARLSKISMQLLISMKYICLVIYTT